MNFVKISVLFSAFCLLLAGCNATESISAGKGVNSQQSYLSIDDQMYLRRAIETAHWSMPWNNYKAMEEGFKEGLGSVRNDVVYYSKPVDWRTVITTPNNTTLYILSFWDTNIDGPMIIDVPATTDKAGLFGTLMDSWQRPLIDVGGQGHDMGKGAKYLVLPPGYKGTVPQGYVPVESKTNKGFFLFRVLLKGITEENLAAGNAFIQDFHAYPLSQATINPTSKHHDASGRSIHAVSTFSDKYFDQLNQMVQAEVVEMRDMAARGMAEAIGMVKGKPFTPTANQRELLKQAAAQVHKEVKYSLNKPPKKFWEGSTWAYLVDPKVFTETGLTWLFSSYLDYRYRSDIYFSNFSSVKKLGKATMYMLNGSDSNGNLLKGENNYVLHLPPNVPVKRFWAVLNYDLNTASFIANTPKAGITSLDPGLQKNEDGSIDIYLGPKAPAGKEANWSPTVAGVNYFMTFRYYGPTENVFNNSWQLGDIERVE
jgi:hypothetical protein